MPSLKFNDQHLPLLEGETVLEGLLRHGFDRPSSCRSGVCQSCMMKVVEGVVPKTAQAGLKPAWQSQGYFLPCVCKPEGDLTVADTAAQETCAARISRIEPLGASVLRVTVEPTDAIAFEGGQFVNLVRPSDGLTRPYSIASTAEDGQMELHVAVLADGRMSRWLEGAEGEEIMLRGPAGECFYQPGTPEAPLLLVGTGTGLAPLLGVIRTALKHGHTGPIHLYRGSPRASALYLNEALSALAAQHDNIHLHQCVLDNDSGLEDVRMEAIDAAVSADLKKLDGFEVYLCGNPDLVRKLKRNAYLAGASLHNIHADPFISA